MLWDTQRNAAYEKAIAKAVEYKREFGCRDILTIDAGAGTGLLGMMAGIIVGLCVYITVIISSYTSQKEWRILYRPNA